MKIIIVGLGNFGSSLGGQLTKMGHEVIGVDRNMQKVEHFKESFSHTICLNSADATAVRNLPIRDADVVLVAIGEDEGANILTTALMKQMKAKRLISRAVSPLHKTILEAMQVDEIVHPEEETANRWAWKLNLHNVLESFPLSPDYHIVEAYLPEQFEGKTLEEAGFMRNYRVVVLSTMKVSEEKNELGSLIKKNRVQGVAHAKTKLEKGDVLVLYGHIRDIKRLLE
jgi:trk system potassium uptake protein TrkA